MSWTDNLLNPNFKTAVNKAIADGALTYEEMLILIKSLAVSGMTESELSDLKVLYNNALTLFSSNYVKEITYNFVFGNPANEFWWGGSKTLSEVVSLGDLNGQTTELNMNRLIGKWFLGTDLPVPLAGGDTATGKASTKTFDYAMATGTLFVNGVSATDVNQGAMGDCYLVAALGAIANAKPNLINDMFVENSNGTYGVRYYANGTTYYTTVDKNFVVLPGTATVIGGSNLSRSLDGEMWVTLAEKAYAQLNMQLDIDQKTLRWMGENSYQAIENGWAHTLKQIANLNYVYYSSYRTSLPDAYSSGFYYSTNPQEYKQVIIDALNAGSVGWLGSWGLTKNDNGKRDFVAGHAFMLLGYNASNDKFIFRNPWGGDGAGDFNPQFEAGIETFWNSSVKAVVALTDNKIKDTVYKYSLVVDAQSTQTAIAEGGVITIKIGRDSSGTSSTVYLNTVAGTAGSADFSMPEKVGITFFGNELIKTFTINTYRDVVKEGVEDFLLRLCSQPNDTTALVEVAAYIKDAVDSDFVYSISNTASSSESACGEGNSVTFTITRNGSGVTSTVYLSTLVGTAGESDYLGLEKEMLSFSPNETTKLVSIVIQKDQIRESIEDFSLVLFKNIGDTNASVTSTAFIKDTVEPLFSYGVTSDASTESTAKLEGGKVKFTITRDGTGAESTIFVSTISGTAGQSDFLALEKKAVTFEANQTIATIEVSVNEDWWLESIETFRLGLYKSAQDSKYFTSASAFIKDAQANSYQYTISTPNSAAESVIVEGATLSFTLTRSGTGSASTVYLSTVAGTADNKDFSPLNKVAVNFAEFETSKTVTIPTYSDELTEGTEYFLVNLYQNIGDSSYVSFTQAYIKDAAIPNYTYSITSNASNPDKAIEEGGNVIYIITRSASGTASTVYVSTSDGTAVAGDYAAVNKQAVVFSPYEIIKTFTVATVKDNNTENPEYFWLNLYKNYSDSEFATYVSSYVKDAALPDYSYAISTDAGSAEKAIVEGGKITVTVTRSGSGSASTVYLNSVSGTAHAADYAPFSASAVNFAAHETVKTLMVDTYVDNLIEGTEYLYIDLYKTLNDRVYTTFAKAFIKDAKEVSYDYSITSSAGSIATAAQEGNEISFTITRSASNGESTVYVSAFDGTADSSDYGIFSKQAVIFAPYETSKVIKVNTFKDVKSEGIEYFWVTLYKNYSDTEFAAYSVGLIADSAEINYDYVLSCNASVEEAAVSEGGMISVTITRNASGSASTVYLSTVGATANSNDFAPAQKYAVSFSADETVKTVTLDTYLDSVKEDTEFLWIELYKNYSDQNYLSYTKAYIKDVSVTQYDYVLTSSAGSSDVAVSEGGVITYTITRNGSGSASTVYVETSEGTASNADFIALSKQAVNFSSDETVKTITISTLKDTQQESTEYFWMGLFKNFNETNNATFSQSYIKDVVAANDEYTITSDAGSLSAAAVEGKKITLTVTRSSSGNPATVYLSTAWGSASAADVSVMDKLALNFLANETVKTVIVDTYVDSLKEDAEYFWVELRKNYSDQSANCYAKSFLKDADASYEYALTSSAESTSSAVVEGEAVKFTITRSGSATASTIYVSTEHITTDAGDYVAVGRQAVIFDAGETSKSITVTTITDTLSENVESFRLNLYKEEADLLSTTSVQAFVKDFVAVNYDYSITTNASSSESAAVEGAKITVTINRTGSGSASTVFISTTTGSANASDFSVLNKLAVNFAPDETVKVLTIDTFTDSQSEGEESFWIDLFKNQNDQNYLTYTKVYIKDAGSGLGVPEGELSVVSRSVYPPVSVSGGGNIFPNHSLGEFRNSTAFALLRSDGSVLCWGDKKNGGDVGIHALELNGQNPVLQIYSATEAFAALRQDGSVVSWGNSDNGGEAGLAKPALNGEVDVQQIFSTQYAFAALLENGAVVSWGNAQYGGDQSAVATLLSGESAVKHIYSNSAAFAAIRADGSVVTWGHQNFGGNSEIVATQLKSGLEIVAIYSSSSAFSALRADGSVISWGNMRNGGDSSSYANWLNGSKRVIQMSSTNSAFAALFEDGSVISWGDDGFGGDSSAVTGKLSPAFPVQKIYSTSSAFAALRKDGTVVTWGYSASGGTVSDSVGANLVNVTQIIANKFAFAAIRANGSVVTWGDVGSGGDSSKVAIQLDGKNPVTKIFATDHAFAALRADGSLVTWGDVLAGGDASEFGTQLNGQKDVVDVLTNGAAFVALHADGSFVNWGDVEIGGNGGSYASSISNVVSGTNIYTDEVYLGGKGIVGSVTAESISGTWGSDVIQGLEGDDKITGGIGHDKIDGGLGLDISAYMGNRVNFKISATANGFTVNDGKGSEGIDSLNNIEALKFADMTINLTVGEKAKAIAANALQSIVELYIAYFNRVPDADGMAYWIDQYQAGTSIDQIGASFYAAAVSPAFSALTGYSTTMSNADFIKKIYLNVLGRTEVDQGGMDYWSGSLANGTETRGSLIKTIIGAAHGFKGNAEFGYVADLLDNKYLVGKYFAIEQGINYNTPEESYSKGVAIAALITSTDTSAALALIGVSDVGFSLL